MDSGHQSFTISSKETLLARDQQPSPPKTTTTRNYKNLKTILLALLLLLLLVAASMSIMSSIDKKKRQLKRLDSYESGSALYFCHLTVYRNHCYDSMSSIINTTVLSNGPGPIFSASLKVAINQLNNVMISITERSRASSSNASLVIGPRMSDCKTWVHDSLGRLKVSLSMLDPLSDFESFTYVDIDNLKSAAGDAYQCLVALDEIMDGGEKITGVEEVKVGVEKARKYTVNSIGLLENREAIISEFYSPYLQIVDEYYGYNWYYYFEYRFIVALYSAAYIFLGLLYFLFFKSS